MFKNMTMFLMLSSLFFAGCGEDDADTGSNKDNSNAKVVNPESSQLEQVAPEEKVDEIIDAGPANAIVWEQDGAKMALIPTGSFDMGDHSADEEGRDSERPVHTVELDAFYIDCYEVTMRQWKLFKKDGVGAEAKEASPTDEHPIVFVNHMEAKEYAAWAGKRLPTEAEWEYAARGGFVGKRFPWGDEGWDDDKVAREHANFDGRGGKDKWKTNAPVGSFPPNGYGLFDMAGNAPEWVADGYDATYYSKAPKKNPFKEPAGQFYQSIARGGSWRFNTFHIRVANRGAVNAWAHNGGIGLRCVISKRKADQALRGKKN